MDVYCAIYMLGRRYEGTADRRENGTRPSRWNLDDIPGWELTVGIEIHAQLNTTRKLFSNALTDPSPEPNSRVAEFDLALPGSQPQFQYATLIPAIRAATILGCDIQQESRFDRKHYFYHDQPSGYQITQYYHPFAKDGVVVLDSSDGLEPDRQLVIGIKQVQLEQDTARTQDQDAGVTLVDFNRAGHPLLEIISLPQIHSPRVAAAYVKKIQALLYAVDAVTTGMEHGGLRADVNVSVRRTNSDQDATFSYGGVTGLGQRTEIKNLGTIKGVEDAIRAERDRQIEVLENGGVIEGETRGWSITRPDITRRLRGKEGEVDYRYMPDPDIPPLYVGSDLTQHIAATLPPIPEELAMMLTDLHGLSNDIISHIEPRLLAMAEPLAAQRRMTEIGKLTGNWVLHELGSLLTTHERAWSEALVPVREFSALMRMLYSNELTTTSAKHVLKTVFESGGQRTVQEIVDTEKLAFRPLSQDEYKKLVEKVIAQFPDHVKDIVKKGKHNKIKFLMGQMMSSGDRSRIQAPVAEKHLRQRLLGDAHADS
ncbi:Glutamyl-tRNA(Gln) amidotransferase subunit B, mitochondrial [Cyphellophora attinorum]|uniref:Glutamyl-tRNA(Gln) amidotransferase subunit B, mitochondrial n=1 Tax=Cyphellophora attinorum TaxID=1664694 RepID=A0A0N1HKT4_9EURO|nr:Glutamyl-tRNA(Gln) amidotransferase subunit B, mitochondrial [Phialophora attinorum]KPI34960.1 Glutamyl-tRNA(Gln) amidotransferase subunit B, mitochondrial [Phialophora attinorum]